MLVDALFRSSENEKLKNSVCDKQTWYRGGEEFVP